MVGLKFKCPGRVDEANLYLVRGINGLTVKVMATYKGNDYVVASIAQAGVYLHNARDLPFKVDGKKRPDILNEDIRRDVKRSHAIEKMYQKEG